MSYFLLRSFWLLVCWLELSLFTLTLYILAWLPRPVTEPYYHRLFRIWCRFFVRALGVDLRLIQNNSRPVPEQYILIANHPSALEDVGIPANFDIYPLAKKGVMEWFLVGRINVAAGTVFVKRDDSGSRHSAFDKLKMLLEDNKNIALFPEGGCFGRRITRPFKYGAFDLSIQTGVPILPVFLHYEAQEDFEWKQGEVLLQKMWHFMTARNNRANYYVYDAIYPDKFKDKIEFSEYVYGMYQVWQQKHLE
jgi:1-acyl-sn-glycerol-3-phosphate acyltransferase